MNKNNEAEATEIMIRIAATIIAIFVVELLGVNFYDGRIVTGGSGVVLFCSG
jgi:hypothetical protein